MSDTRSKPTTPHSNARFATTHWTIVLAAGSPDSSQYREALETLCRTYWFPLYAYLRRHGYDRHDAAEYTQGFFAYILENQLCSKIQPRIGKFRSYLLTTLKHFLTDEFRHIAAAKRGGGKKPLSLDINDGEAQYLLQPIHNLSPERIFERAWALTVLDKVMDRLEDEYISMGKQRLWNLLKTHLCGDTNAISYRDVAVKLGTTEGAVKTSVYRLRRRYREILYDEIAQTVCTKKEVTEELQALFDAVG